MSDPLAAHGIHPHLKSYVCIEVANHERPVLLVARDDGDGDWCFLCGDEHEGTDWARVVGIGHLTDHDPSLAEVLDLVAGEEAERSTLGGVWVRAPYGGQE